MSPALLSSEIGEVTQEQAQRCAEEFARKLESRVPTVGAGLTTLAALIETVQENIESAGSDGIEPFSVHPDQLQSAFDAAMIPYRKAWGEQKFLKSLTGRQVFDGNNDQQERRSR